MSSLQKESDGTTQLHAACRFDMSSVVRSILTTEGGRKLLLERDAEGNTPLMLASSMANGQVGAEIVRSILATEEGRSSLDMRNSDGKTALHVAAVCDQRGDIVRALLEPVEGRTILGFKDVEDEHTPLHAAVFNSNTEAVKAILQWEEGKKTILDADKNGCTPLHLQCYENRSGTDTVRLFLETKEGKRALGIRDGFDNVPLHYAAQYYPKGNAKDILELEEGRETMLATDSHGNTPLHVLCKATEICDYNTVMLFLKTAQGKAALGVKNNQQMVPLLYAAHCKNEFAVGAILELEVGRRTILTKDGLANTLLHVMCKTKGISARMFEAIILIHHEAEEALSMKNKFQMVPLNVAAHFKNADAMEAILRNEEGKKTIVEQDYEGDTVLHVLCKQRDCNVDVVKKVVDEVQGKVAMGMENQLGKIPLDCALDVGNDAVANMLDGKAATDEDLDSGLGCRICFFKYCPRVNHTKPVIVCDNGHTLCQGCTAKVNDCPNCRGPKLARPIVNRALCEAVEAAEKKLRHGQ